MSEDPTARLKEFRAAVELLFADGVARAEDVSQLCQSAELPQDKATMMAYVIMAVVVAQREGEIDSISWGMLNSWVYSWIEQTEVVKKAQAVRDAEVADD